MVWVGSKKFFFVCCLFLVSFTGFSQFYRGSNVTFGKNRVQYKFFEWFSLQADHFDVFYYTGGKNLAEHTFQFSDQEYTRLKKFYNVNFEDRIQVLVFNKQSDFRQSNLGQGTDENTQIGGTTTIQGNKMFVYFEGSYQDLERQISLGISRIFFLNLMYGANWLNVIKGANRIALPSWFSEGAIRYAAFGDEEAADEFTLDWKWANKRNNLQRLSNDHAARVGQAFWSHIVDMYGENVMVNILNSTQFFRSTDAGFSYMLGKNSATLIHSFLSSMELKNSIEMESTFNQLKLTKRKWQLFNTNIHLKSKYVYKQFVPSSNGRNWAFVRYDKGRFFVSIADLETGKLKVIHKGDIRSDRIPNYSFPVLTWHPSNQILAYIIEKEGKPYFVTYNIETKEKNEKILMQIDQVNSMNYSPDGKRLVFSAYYEGKSDIYVMPISANKPQAITSDLFDDAAPVFSLDGSQIIFSSNRQDSLRREYPDTVKANSNTKHIYAVQWEANATKPIMQLSSGSYQDSHPIAMPKNRVQFIRAKEGKYDRCSVYRDSTIAFIDTVVHYRFFNVTEVLQMYDREITEMSLDSTQKYNTLLCNAYELPVAFTTELMQDKAIRIEGEEVGSKELVKKTYDEMIWIPKAKAPNAIDTKNFLFPADKKRELEEQKRQEEANVQVEKKNLKIPFKKDYRLNFTTDYVQSSWDNQFASDFYQNYVGPSSLNPGFSNFFRVGVSDLMEDYRFTAGVRLSANLSNSDFILSYQNLLNRVDKKVSLQRQNQTFSENGIYIESQTLFLTQEWLYPFNEVSALRFTALARKDRIVVLGIDPVTTSYPNTNEYNLGGKLEYCLDNTYLKGLNYRTGIRFKSWAEHLRQPTNWKEKTSVYVAGFDFRWYQPLHRELTLAFRMSGATSFGAYKVVHYLGGVDNWLFQRVDNSIAVSPNQNYTYQAFAGPLRGFYVNSRNGNNFVVSNTELRLPLFRYLANKPLQSEFTDNFQVIGFFDIGSAWSGRDPYDDENDFNLISSTQKPVTVEIRSNREPIIYGYGFGLRSKVLGYYMRADWAWGVDDQQVMPRVFYLSLNMDF